MYGKDNNDDKEDQEDNFRQVRRKQPLSVKGENIFNVLPIWGIRMIFVDACMSEEPTD